MSVDYIVESHLIEVEAKGGISKVDKFLKVNGLIINMGSIRDLYTLRSSSIAHSKGSNYDRHKAKST